MKSRKNNFQYFLPTRCRQSRTGLTLIELIVVMAIIAILAAAFWTNFIPSLMKGRDSKRKQDLQAIAKAVEMYYNDSRSYPNPTLISMWNQPFPNPTSPAVIYLQKIPADPTYPGYTYCYISDGTYYKLYARLENLSDNDPNKLSPEVACGDASNYNYGISSPNTTP